MWAWDRRTDQMLGSFGRNGRSAGQFHWVHNLALDSHGNIYTAEVDTGKRAQKFTPKDDDRGRGRGRDDRKDAGGPPEGPHQEVLLIEDATR